MIIFLLFVYIVLRQTVVISPECVARWVAAALSVRYIWNETIDCRYDNSEQENRCRRTSDAISVDALSLHTCVSMVTCELYRTRMVIQRLDTKFITHTLCDRPCRYLNRRVGSLIALLVSSCFFFIFLSSVCSFELGFLSLWSYSRPMALFLLLSWNLRFPF